MQLCQVGDMSFAVPTKGAIIEWQKSGAVWAFALLPTGKVLRCPDYDAAADAANSVGNRHLVRRCGYGAHWVPPEALEILARASVEALDNARREAEIAADYVIEYARAYFAGEYESYNDRRTVEQRRDEHADGWVRWRDSSCYFVRRMLDYGYPELATALARRGLAIVFDRAAAWRITSVETALLAVLADVGLDIVRSANPRPHYRGASCLTEEDMMWSAAMQARPLDTMVDTYHDERATWAAYA